VQHRDFPLGAADGIVNQVDFDLKLLALFDLGAVGFKQRMGFGDVAPIACVAALSPELAIWARMARSSAMIS
jgi:hypothetical protein